MKMKDGNYPLMVVGDTVVISRVNSGKATVHHIKNSKLADTVRALWASKVQAI